MLMEPNKLENQFREKLSNREIQPSENAWDRLDAMLSVADLTKNTEASIERKSKYRWMYVAATLLGFILIATIFLFQTQEMIDVSNEQVVFDQNKEAQQNSEESPMPINPILEETLTALPTEKAVVKIEKSNPAQTALKVTEHSLLEKAVEDSNELVAQNTNTTVLENTLKINSKSEVKINAASLLASVDGVTVPNKIELQKSTNIKVSSNELLNLVDNELELSFREKVQQSINKKYREVKVAVAKRNLE